MLCKGCEKLFDMTIKNVEGGSGDRHIIVCLVYPDAFKNLVIGMLDGEYPKVVHCNRFKPTDK